MKSVRKALALTGCIAITVLTGCTAIKSTTNKPQEETKQENTIFDKVIKGEPVVESTALYNVSEMLYKNGISPDSVYGFGNKYIMALYIGEDSREVVTYDLSSAEVYKTVNITENLSKSSYVATTESGVPYVYDKDNRLYLQLNIKGSKYTAYELDFTPEDMLVTDSGNRIYYTLDKDVRVYQYITETGQSAVAYDAGESLDSIELVSMGSDDSTLIIKASTPISNGYAKLSVEMQEIESLSGYDKGLYYEDGLYIYTSDSYARAVCVYDELKPRTFVKFTLENEAELGNMYIYPDGPNIFTIVGDDNGSEIRFYNVSAGIMENHDVIPKGYTVENVSYMRELKAVCISVKDSDGVTNTLIWDVESITDIVS